MSKIPDELQYTADHEWAKVRNSGDTQTVRVGITDFAQQALGDVVFVSLPELGVQLAQGAAFGEVESTKSVSDIYAPISGTVAARNEALDAAPDLVNSDPYGEGWMVEITPAEPGSVEGLLDASAYAALVEES